MTRPGGIIIIIIIIIAVDVAVGKSLWLKRCMSTKKGEALWEQKDLFFPLR